MNKFVPSDKIYISKSRIPKAERGVFAMVDIKKGEIIERCPTIEISKYDTANLGESILVTYFFYFGKNKEKSLIILGFGSIYNHSYNPNAIFKIKEKEKLVEFVALKNIQKDDEITFNYNHETPKSRNPLWFEDSIK